MQLGLNFPADASVITVPFNRSNPASYNKTTALTVYDQGGNSYLATVYYAKTQNASQADPTNKWQTYVFIGDTQVNAALTQATDANGEKLYVNKYGQLAPENQVADQLVNRKTQMFELDNLNDQRTSVPASISGKAVTDYDLTTQSGLPASEVAANLTDLQNFMTVDVDGSGEPVTLDISSEMQAIVASGQAKISGAEIAQVLQNKLRQDFGDDAYWNFSTAASQKFSLEISDPNSPSSSTVLNVNLSQIGRAHV